MNQDEPHPGRPLQFSLRSLLWSTAAVAVIVVMGKWWGVGGALFAAWILALTTAYMREYLQFEVTFPLLVLSAFVGGCLILPGISSREVHPRNSCVNNLKQIALGVLNYDDAKGSLPPSYVVDDEGRRMHSWRTLILPFIEGGNVYDAYDFDEPWDGPNNSKLAINIGMFICPSDPPTSAAQCNYVAVVGPGTLWPDGKTMSLAEVAKRDGLSSTIMLVEICDSGITWPEPRDLDIRTMVKSINAGKGLGISSRHAGGAFVAFANARIEFLSEDTLAKTLQAMLTVDGGEVIDEDDF